MLSHSSYLIPILIDGLPLLHFRPSGFASSTLMIFDVQVGYSYGRGFHARWTETHKPSGLGNPTPTYSTTDFDCQSSLGVNLRNI